MIKRLLSRCFDVRRIEATSSIEMLEARIAPATVVSGGASDYIPDTTQGNHPIFEGPDGLMTLGEAIKHVNFYHDKTITFAVDEVTVGANEGLGIDGKVTITGTAAGDGPGTVIHGSGGTGLFLAKGGKVSNLVINGFSDAGLSLFGAGTIENCYIGTDKTGTTAVPNMGAGVQLNGSGVTIKNCVISGNTGEGVEVGSGAGIKVEGNKIGVDATGMTALPNQYGVYLHSGAKGVLIGGTTPEQRNIISGNTKDGVVIETDGNTVSGNYIGVGSDGTAKVANGESGVHILGANKNKIGGTKEVARNIISGNKIGVKIEGQTLGFTQVPAMSNVVAGNYIGLDANGALLKNFTAGVDLEKGAEQNTVGGTNDAARNIIAGSISGVLIKDGLSNKVQGNYIGTGKNGSESGFGNNVGVSLSGTADGNLILTNVISGNQSTGVLITGAGGFLTNVVAGNLIGLSADGSALLSNPSSGVAILAASSGNLIGGANAKARNVIAGSAKGVELDHADFNTVQGNYIGAGMSGMAKDFGNNVGVSIAFSGSSVIGGDKTSQRNIISGNVVGVRIENGVADRIEGNFIGTDSTGKAPLANQTGILTISARALEIVKNVISGNSDNGVSLTAESFAGLAGNFIGTDSKAKLDLHNGSNGVSSLNSGCRIGGVQKSEVNIIAFNKGEGILADGGSDNVFVENSIFSNEGLGIKLINNANFGVPPPVILTAEKVAGKFTITGTLAGAENLSVSFELYSNKHPDPRGGEGETFLEVVTATLDASGRFTAVFKKAPRAGSVLSLTATVGEGTSAFSNNKTV